MSILKSDKVSFDVAWFFIIYYINVSQIKIYSNDTCEILHIAIFKPFLSSRSNIFKN